MTKYIASFFITSATFFLVSIYTFQFNAITGNTVININDYRGKKILLVNTASNSPHVNQYAKLEQLHQLYKDSLVIIAFPSNSFGHEPGDNASIHSFLMQTYHPHFKIAAKSDIVGTNANPIFKWVADINQNGVMNITITKDFDKILIDKNGGLVGVFGQNVNPMSSEMQDAIRN